MVLVLGFRKEFIIFKNEFSIGMSKFNRNYFLKFPAPWNAT